MGFHDRMRNMVIRQLGVGGRGKGVDVLLDKTTPGVYNPKAGKVEGATTVTLVGSGVRVNYKDTAYKSEVIVYGDFQLYLSPVLQDGTECPKPRPGDTIIIQSEIVKVIAVSPFNDNSANCGWKLQVRNG